MILFLSIALNISYLFNVKEICSPIFINMSVFIFSCIAILDGSFLKIKNKLESNPYSTGVKYSSMTNKILLFFVILLLICNFSNCFFNDQLVKEEKDKLLNSSVDILFAQLSFLYIFGRDKIISDLKLKTNYQESFSKYFRLKYLKLILYGAVLFLIILILVMIASLFML